MTKPHSLLATVLTVAFLSAILLAPIAYAAVPISGYTRTSSGVTLPDTKITMEKAGVYQWQRSGSTGFYSFQADSGNTYLMSAMKGKDGKYVADWNVNAPATKDWSLAKDPLIDVKILMVTDEEFRATHPSTHENDASVLTINGANNWFIEEHRIWLKKIGYRGDFISNESNCQQLAGIAQNQYPPSVYGWEMLVLVVGSTTPLSGEGIGMLGGCAMYIPWAPNQATVTVVKDGFVDMHELTMHEVTHNFGFSHTYGQRYGNPITDFYTVMHAFGDDPMQIKNWTPFEDQLFEEGDGTQPARREWYRDGGIEISAHRQSNNAEINGLFVSVYSSDGTLVKQGYTPFYLDVVNSGTYFVDFANYGNYYFTTPKTVAPGAISDYAVYSWGGRVTVNAADRGTIHLDAIYYDHANPGNFARVTYQSSYTNGAGLNGMGTGTRDSTGTLLTKGFTPFTVGMPTNQNLVVSWNNWAPNYYQYGDTNATESGDVKASWGGEQTIRMGTNGGIYTDTGRYLSCGSPC